MPPRTLPLVLGGIFFISVIIILRSFLLWYTQIPTARIATLTNHIGQVRYLSQSTARHALEIAVFPSALAPGDSVRQLQIFHAETALLLQRTDEIDDIQKQNEESGSLTQEFQQISILARKYATAVSSLTTRGRSPNVREEYTRAAEMSTQLVALVNRVLQEREQVFAAEQSRNNLLRLITLLLTLGFIAGWAGIFWWMYRRNEVMEHRQGQLEHQVEKERTKAEHLVNAVSGILWEADAATFQFTYLSEAVEKILGYTAQEWINSPTFWQDHLHPDDRQANIDFCIAATHAMKDYDFEYRFVKADGSIAWMRDLVTVEVEDGKAMRLKGIMTDITEQKHIAQELRKTEEHFRSAVKALGEGIVLQDSNGAIAFCNPRAEEILGLSTDQMSGRTSFDPRWRAVYEDGSPFPGEEHPAMVTLRTGEGQHNVVMGIHKPNGELTWLLVNSQPIRYTSTFEISGVVVSFTDITAQKLQEQKLSASEERFRLITENSLDLVAQHTPEGNYTYLSPSVEMILGYTPEELLGKNPYELFHPEDQLRIRNEAHELAMRGEISTIITYRIQSKDGSYRWLETKTKPLFTDGTSTVRALQTFSRDVTERTLAEAKKRENEQFISRLLEAVPGGVYVYDMNENRNVFATEANTTLLGYSPQEIQEMGTTFLEQCFHPDDMGELMKHNERLDTNPIGTVSEITYRFKHKDGRWIWLLGREVVLERNPETGAHTQHLGVVLDVTALKEMQMELAESNERMKSLLGAIPVPITVTRLHDGEVIFNNAALQEYFMLPSDIAEHLVSVNFYAYPEDRTRFVEELQSTGKVDKKEIQLKTLHGEERWAIVSALPFLFEGEQAVFAAFSDITVQKEAAQKLMRSEQRYRSFVDLQTSYFIRTDLEGRYTYASPSMVKDYSPGGASVIGRHGFEHIIPQDHEMVGEAVERCLQTPGIPIFVILRKPHISGKIKTSQWEFIAIANEDGVLSEIQCVGHDITESVEAHEEITMLNKTLESRVEQRTRALVELNNEKNEFLGIAAHDLKNPLAGILSSADILTRYYADNDHVNRFVNMIVSGSKQMLDIINSFLDVNRIESGKMVLNLKPISLTVIESIVKEYQQRASLKGIIIQHEFSADSSQPIVMADEQALWQVADNLISNAVKYSPHWRSVLVRILQQTNESGVLVGRLEVQDEGPGISEEDKKRMFGKFERLTAQPTGGENSTGLGLSIVKKLVEMQNGRIWCESELGKGATFIVELPIAEAFSLPIIT